jgi:hypothetical protein
MASLEVQSRPVSDHSTDDLRARDVELARDSLPPPPVPWLSRRARRALNDAQRFLERRFGESLRSLVLVGRAAHPTREDHASGPELLAVLDPRAIDDVAALADALRGPIHAGTRVHLSTIDELERSADVCTLELAEWKSRHVLLSGVDPFANVTWRQDDLRRDLERELRSLARELRDRVLAAIASRADRSQADAAVAEGVDRLVIVAHHALCLVDGRAPVDEPAALVALAAKCDADPTPIVAALASLRAGGAVDDPVATLRALLAVIRPATSFIDRLQPSP